MYARPAGTFLRSRRRARAGPRLRSATRGLLSESLTGRREELVCSSKSATSLNDSWRLGHSCPDLLLCGCLPATSHRAARPLAHARIGARALAVHRQVPPVADPTVAADLHQP